MDNICIRVLLYVALTSWLSTSSLQSCLVHVTKSKKLRIAEERAASLSPVRRGGAGQEKYPKV